MRNGGKVKLQGKKAVITGASSGIGAEFARQIHDLGADVVLAARRKDRLERLAEELTHKRGNSTEVIAVDLTSEQDTEGVLGIRSLSEKLSTSCVDLLVNNAGAGSFGFFHEQEIDREIEMVKLNISAVLRLAHAVIPQMKQRRSGAIVCTSSIAAFQPLPFMSTYAATKAFDFFHALALHGELKSYGIRVLAACPGPTATEFGGVARVPGSLTGGPRDSVQAVVSQSLQALHKGHLFVLPGWRGKVLGALSRVAPYSLSVRIAQKVLADVYRKAPR